MGTPHAILRRDNEIYFHEPTRVMRENSFTGRGPAPTTKTAIIACYACTGSEDKTIFRRHNYLGRKTVSSKEGVPLYHEMHYKCCSCGMDRVWGTEIVG